MKTGIYLSLKHYKFIDRFTASYITVELYINI